MWTISKCEHNEIGADRKEEERQICLKIIKYTTLGEIVDKISHKQTCEKEIEVVFGLQLSRKTI